MSQLIKHDPFDISVKWSEDDIQMHIVQWLRRSDILFAADQNAGRRSARDGARRKMLGMAAGEPDLRIYLKSARTIFIELKTSRGRVSPAQKDRIKGLNDLGFTAVVVAASCPGAGLDQVKEILHG